MNTVTLATPALLPALNGRATKLPKQQTVTDFGAQLTVLPLHLTPQMGIRDSSLLQLSTSVTGASENSIAVVGGLQLFWKPIFSLNVNWRSNLFLFLLL